MFVPKRVPREKQVESSQDIVKSILTYDTETGVFEFINSGTGIRKDRVAGSVNSFGYRTISVLGTYYKAHRLAWVYCHGPISKYDNIDHINGKRDDDCLRNLRIATNSENGYNSNKSCRNTSGYKGVSWYANYKKWAARCNVDGKSYHLGYFDTAEIA